MNIHNILPGAVLVACVMMATAASAYDFEKEGLHYTITSQSEHTVSVESYFTNAETYDHIGVGTNPSVPEAKPHRAQAEGYSVVIPAEVEYGNVAYSVTAISDGAFHDKVKMTSVEIPATVTTIGASAFSGCRSLAAITNHATTPQAITSSVFANVNRTATLVVPASVVNAYRNADVWREFAIETYADFVLGDANGDGVVTVADLSLTASYILGTGVEGFAYKAADVNGDGTITVADLASMANYILQGSWPTVAQVKAYMP